MCKLPLNVGLISEEVFLYVLGSWYWRIPLARSLGSLITTGWQLASEPLWIESSQEYCAFGGTVNRAGVQLSKHFPL
jgi:hypothetical protein